jgi:hypothetical protein
MTSQGTAAGRVARPGVAAGAWQAPDARRRLQLCLAAIWLLDGVLQYQSSMFTRGFGQMLAASAAGNPAFVADPVTWAAAIIQQYPATTDAAFATVQLALGLGLAWRRSVRVALAASIAWSLAVWWLGEGLGGVLNGGASPVSASPVSGAPGAVILYALLAVLLWPAGGDSAGGQAAPFVAARPIGERAARVVWLVLWGSLAYFAVQAQSRTAQGLHDLIAGMAAGEPGWLASLDHGAASLLAHRGLAASLVLGALLAAVAAGVFLPVPVVRVTVVVAIVLAAVFWVVGQDLGGLLAGGATDVNSAPLLALIALAYWPRRAGVSGP